MALLALANLGLVGFDLSYVPWRNFWFRNFPGVTQVYDRVKGIEPHRDTEAYLDSVNALQQELQQTGLQSPQVQARLKGVARSQYRNHRRESVCGSEQERNAREDQKSNAGAYFSATPP